MKPGLVSRERELSPCGIEKKRVYWGTLVRPVSDWAAPATADQRAGDSAVAHTQALRSLWSV